ncbi:MAG: hypothetical protein ACRBM6_37900 [Geminicoccales bacterium]
MIPDMNACAAVATGTTCAGKPSLRIETTEVNGPDKGAAEAASNDRMLGTIAMDCRQREVLPPTRHRGTTTIFEQAVRTANALRDIPARSKSTCNGIRSGTMAVSPEKPCRLILLNY